MPCVFSEINALFIFPLDPTVCGLLGSVPSSSLEAVRRTQHAPLCHPHHPHPPRTGTARPGAENLTDNQALMLSSWWFLAYCLGLKCFARMWCAYRHQWGPNFHRRGPWIWTHAPLPCWEPLCLFDPWEDLYFSTIYFIPSLLRTGVSYWWIVFENCRSCCLSSATWDLASCSFHLVSSFYEL